MSGVVNKERLLWLDWMKVLALLSIIWGHFFSEGHLYLYVFSVQSFCVISGFLYKKAPNWEMCLKKCFWQLFVPTVIMSVTMHLEVAFRCWVNGGHYDILWLWFCRWLLLGDRWCMGPCWYFYTLIIMRIIMQFIPEKRWAYILLFFMLSGTAIFLHIKGVEASNANVNVVVCMPLFLIGVMLKPFIAFFDNNHRWGLEVVLLICSVVVVFLCGIYNGCVWMYLNGFGRNFVLFIIGGMAGLTMLYVVSRWLCSFSHANMINTLAQGSILIIGIHIIIVRRLALLPDRFWMEDLMFSILIMLAFVPIIRFVSRFFPILLGRHKNDK